MLVNVSYNDKELNEKIDKETGKPFTLSERFMMGGTGSPKLFITGCSLEIYNLLILDNNLDTCNIEIRPKGIIIRFRSLLETYALVVPFYKLKIYKVTANEYAIYRDHYHLKVAAKTKQIHEFFRKVLKIKSDNAPTSIDEL